MDPKAQDLFGHALELPEEERGAFLADACGADAELRLEVQRMLVDVEKADVLFGDRGAFPLEATVPADAAAVKDLRHFEEEGERIGPYKLLQEIGEGGFGTVWMAEQTEAINRKVALKVVKLGMDTREVIARFEAERQALALMDHENIAKVLDAGATDRGRPYFVMELVKGIPITQYCDETGLGTRRRLELFRDVCSAINHAHQKGVIHRDIKPSNVMITLHGDKPVVKVIDFGIAKATQGKLTDKTLFTRFEQFVGTPVYMSPEQAVLSGLDIDTRSDIYALGVLLYELLTGRPPFDPKTLASAGYDEMRRIIREVEPPKPSSKLATLAQSERTTVAKTHHIEPNRIHRLIEPDLDWIIMKAIEKDRSRRYDTANALSMDIKRFLANEPVLATPPSAAYQFRKFARRHKAAFRAAAVIAVALLAGTVISTWQAIRATQAESDQRSLRLAAERAEASKEEQRQAAEAARSEEQRLRRLAQLQAYAADMKAAQAALQQSSRQQAVNLLDQHWPKPGEDDLRGVEWRYLWQAARGDEIYTWNHPGMTPGALFSPDGREIATACFDGTLRIWNVASGKQTGRFERNVPDESVKVSFCYLPDGRSLVTASHDGLVLLDVASWLPRKVLDFPEASEPVLGDLSLRCSADGRWLAAASQNGGFIRCWDTASWESLRLELPVDGRVAFSPDGRRIACPNGEGAIDIVDLEARRRVLALRAPSIFPGGNNESWFLVDWVQSGKRVVAASGFGYVAMWDAGTGEEIWARQAHKSRIYGLAVNHDGSRFATGGFDQNIHLWNAATHEIEATRQGHLNEVWSLQFSPDDRFLLSSSKDGTAKLWDVRSVPAKGPWLLEKGEFVLGFTREKQGFLSMSGDGSQLRQWRGRQLVRSVPLPGPVPDRFTIFSPETQNLYLLGNANELRVVDSTSLETRHSVRLVGRCSMLYHVSADERWLSGRGGSTRELIVWDLRSGEQAFQIDELQGNSNSRDLAAFSPDGRLLAFGDQAWKAVLVETGSWRTLRSLEPHPWRIYALSFSADSRLLASSSWEGDIRVTNCRTGEEVAPRLYGHGSGVHGHSFSPDAATLISGGDDASVRMWSVATGREMLVFPGAYNQLARAPFLSPGADLLVWKDFTRELRTCLHDLPSLEEIEAAERAESPAAP